MAGTILNEHVRIHFPLDVIDNWPPVSAENLWAISTDIAEEFVIDSIPFFVKGVAAADTVQALAGDGETLTFKRFLKSGGHSTVRVFITGHISVEVCRSEIIGLGCAVEIGGFAKLLAVDVPNVALLSDLRGRLDDLESRSLIDYEEGKVAN